MPRGNTSIVQVQTYQKGPNDWMVDVVKQCLLLEQGIRATETDGKRLLLEGSSRGMFTEQCLRDQLVRHTCESLLTLAYKKPLFWIKPIVLSIVFSETECLSFL